MIEALLVGIVLLVLGAFLLPAAEWLVMAWVRLYTWPIHPDLRARRREEMASDLWELRQADREDGYSPAEIGFHILVRAGRGLIDDLAWSLPRAVVFEELIYLNGAATIVLLVVTSGDIWGDGAGDLILRVAPLLTVPILLHEVVRYRQVRFAAPAVEGNGIEGLRERYKLYDRVLLKRGRRGHARTDESLPEGQAAKPGIDGEDPETREATG